MIYSISPEFVAAWHKKINLLSYASLADARARALEQYKNFPHAVEKQLEQLFVVPDIAWHEVAYADVHVAMQQRDDAIFVGDVREFVTQHPQHAEKYLNVGYKKNKNQLFVDACWNCFLVVFVPHNVRDAEIVLPEISAHLLVQKIIIVVQKGAHVSVRMAGQIAELRMQALACIVEDNAQLTFVGEDAGQVMHGSVDYTFLLGAHSLLHFSSYMSSAQISQITLNVIAQGRGAHAICRGLYILDEQQQVVINTHQEHTAAETTSDIIFKGILSGQARAFFKGTIAVGEQGKKSTAALYNKNMLVSAQARAVSMPQLEVATNDVQCKHGSAISHLDKQHLLYLQSRGLDTHSAQTLLLASFVNDCIDLAYVPQVQKKLQVITQRVS